MALKPILRTEGLDVGYGKKTVVQDVDIQACKGQTLCLIGPNGAGKSTVLRTLAGMLAPVGGCVYIGDAPLERMRQADKAKKMAVVLTEKLQLSLTCAREIVAMGRAPYTGFFGKLSPEDGEIVDNCLKTVGAWELRERDFMSLSDGEKQKVLIARALAQTPELIVLDEPTSHLDIKHKIEVIRILNGLARTTGLTVILALHDIDLAVKFCQVVLMVKGGRIVAQGRPEDIVRRDTLSALYDIEGAHYDALLGSVELCNKAAPELFVVAGAGCGIPIYRMAARLGMGVATGILQAQDVDCVVARDMGLTVVETPAFTPVTEESVREANRWVQTCGALIDAGFPIGKENESNVRILAKAAREGKEVFALRAREELDAIYGGAGHVRRIATMAELSGELARVSHRPERSGECEARNNP